MIFDENTNRISRWPHWLILSLVALLCAGCGGNEMPTPAATAVVPAATAAVELIDQPLGAAAVDGPYWKGVAVSSPGAYDATTRTNMLNDMGASWWYSWGYEDQYFADSRFVPMVSAVRDGQYVGGICTAPACLAHYAGTYPGRTWLLLNEPERVDQANMAPAQAASQVNAMVSAMSEADPTARFMCCGTWTDQAGTTWMSEFLDAVTVPLDGVHVHAYEGGSPNHRIASLEGYWQTLQAIPASQGLPVWITELGYLCREGTSEWVRDWLAAPFFEWYRCGGGHAMYERVAWYTTDQSEEEWMPTHLYDANLNKTPLGYFYRLLGDIPPPPALPQPEPPGQQVLFTPAEDTYINAWYSISNFGQDNEIVVRSTNTKSSLLRFDLSALPDPEAITYARLLLYNTRAGYSPISLDIHRVLRPWNESEATWSLATSTQFWAGSGCNALDIDRLGGTAALINLDPNGGPWYTADLTALVKSWIGSADKNHGMLLRGTGNRTGEYAFASSEHPDACWQPRLEVWYQPGSGIPTHTPTSTASLTPTPLPTATHTDTALPTATSTSTTEPSATPGLTGTAQPTDTSTPVVVETETPIWTDTPGPSPTPSHTPTWTPTGAATMTPTPSLTLSAIETRVSGMERNVPALATRVALVNEIFQDFQDVEWLQESYDPDAPPKVMRALRVSLPPVVDGDLSDWSDERPVIVNRNNADYVWGQEQADNADPQVEALARWDENFLYLALRVRDLEIVTDSQARYWQDDGIEFALDGANDGVYAGQGDFIDDYAFGMRPDGVFANYDQAPPNIMRSVGFWEYGYVVELGIPLQLLSQQTVDSSTRMGINIAVRDDDDGGNLESYVVWEGSNMFIGQGDFGELRFQDQLAEEPDLSAQGQTRSLTGSVVLQNGISGYRGTEDSYVIDGECEDINLGGQESMGIGLGPLRRPLLRFSLLDQMPPNAEVTRAVLSVRAYSGGPNPLQLELYQVLKPWEERSVTWTQANDAVPWTLPGCDALGLDRENRVAAVTTLSSLNVWYSFDITALAQKWVQEPNSNQGVVLVPLDGPSANYQLYTSESPHLGWRPMLSVYYRVP